MTEEPRPSDEDAWADIVANFGERAELTPSEASTPPPALTQPVQPPEQSVWFHVADSDDHYQPPVAPPVGLAAGLRGAAWLGVVGLPVVFLVAVIVNLDVPHILGWILLIAFLASLGYLFATMRRDESDDPWDDGSRV